MWAAVAPCGAVSPQKHEQNIMRVLVYVSIACCVSDVYGFSVSTCMLFICNLFIVATCGEFVCPRVSCSSCVPRTLFYVDVHGSFVFSLYIVAAFGEFVCLRVSCSLCIVRSHV